MLAFEVLEQKLIIAFQSSDTCPICYRTLEYDSASITTCGHVHCRECIFRSREIARPCPSCRFEDLGFIFQFACCEEIPRELRLDGSLISLREPEDGSEEEEEEEDSDSENDVCPYDCAGEQPCLYCSTPWGNTSFHKIRFERRDDPESSELKADILDYDHWRMIENAIGDGYSSRGSARYWMIVMQTDRQSWNGRMLEKANMTGLGNDDYVLEPHEDEWYVMPDLYGQGMPGMLRKIVPWQIWVGLQERFPEGVPKSEFERLVSENLLEHGWGGLSFDESI